MHNIDGDRKRRDVLTTPTKHSSLPIKEPAGIAAIPPPGMRADDINDPLMDVSTCSISDDDDDAGTKTPLFLRNT